MEKVCPTCNAINNMSFPCISCDGRMVDKGRISDYFDDYSADMPIENEEGYCTHVYQCSKCGELKNYKIKFVNA
jgi:hypothetical protein